MPEISQISFKRKTIQVYNSFFGTESVFINQELVSKKWSLFGTKHVFLANGESLVLQTKLPFLESDKSVIMISAPGETAACFPVQSKRFTIKRFILGLIFGVVIYMIFKLN
jgi:hypothetical protein